jgi:hypothetical protein
MDTSDCADYISIKKYDALRAEVERLKEEIEHPKMTYCAYCGQQYDIGDHEAALKAITEHIYTCPRHPMSAIKTDLAAAVEVLRVVINTWMPPSGLPDATYHSIKFFLARLEVRT